MGFTVQDMLSAMEAMGDTNAVPQPGFTVQDMLDAIEKMGDLEQPHFKIIREPMMVPGSIGEYRDPSARHGLGETMYVVAPDVWEELLRLAPVEMKALQS
jgi:hypothetical protein